MHGKSKHTQTQGSVKHEHQDVENMLNSWLESNKMSKWSEGLHFAQLTYNRTFHEGIKCTPYEAMFGAPVKVGLKTSFLNDSIKHLRTKEELQVLIEEVNNTSENTNRKTFTVVYQKSIHNF